MASLQRDVSGLLVRHIAGDANNPFATGDWTAYKLNVSLSNNRLRLSSASAGSYGAVSHDSIASRSKVFAQVVAQGTASGWQFAAAAHVASESALVQSLLADGPNTFFLGEPGNNNSTSANVAANIDYTISLFADGLDLAGEVLSPAASLTKTVSTNSSGLVGMRVLTPSATNVDFERVYFMVDRFVVVSSIPTGGSAEVRKSDDTVLVSASESSGSASLDMLDIAVKDASKVVVLDSGGSEVASLSPSDGVWGGDEYSVSSQPPNKPTLTVGDVWETIANFTSSDFSDDDEDDTHAASQWQVDLQSGDFSSPVLDPGDDASNLTSFQATGLSDVTKYKARVRHKDSAGNYSDWSDAKNFTTGLWNDCPEPGDPGWNEVSGPTLAPTSDAFLWYELEESSGATIAQDSTKNNRDGTHGNGVIDVAQTGPTSGDLAYELDGAGAGVTLAAIGIGEGGNFSSTASADADPDYVAPTIHTNFTAALKVKSTATTFIPPNMSDPPGTGHILDTSGEVNRFVTYPQHGNRGNANDTSDIHAGVGIAVGTNAIVVGEHSHNHVPARAVYEDDLSGWNTIHVVYKGDPKTTGNVRIYVGGTYCGNLSGTYREGSSIKARPFLVDPFLTMTDGDAFTEAIGFEGLIADFRIWDRVLSDSEIASDEAASGTVWNACPQPSDPGWNTCN